MAALTAVIAAGCGGDDDATDTTDDTNDTIPDGDYRAEFTVDELAAAGVSGTVAENNGGAQVLSINGDRYELKILGSGTCHGTLTYEADQVTFVHAPVHCVPPEKVDLFSANWELTGDDLIDICSEPECPARFDPLMELLYGSEPFVKVEE